VSRSAPDSPLGLPRNYLRPCLLLLLAEGTSHGYELLDQISAFGLDRVDPGGLYRCLRAMDEEGLVRSTWAPSTAGPARRTYSLTREGADWLHTIAEALHTTSQALAVYQQRYYQLPQNQPPQSEQLGLPQQFSALQTR